MITDCVKLRSDLIVSEQQSGGAIIYVLKDPTSGRFFRFKEIEHFILRQLDGHTPLQTIRERTEQTFQAALPDDVLSQFITRLERSGLLEMPGAAPSSVIKSRRIKGDPFYLRIKIFDPDTLFEKLSQKFGFLFTRLFLLFSGAAILLALATTAIFWTEIQQGFYGLFQSFSLLAVWLIVLSVVTAHEFAHGVTCKRFGGQVSEVGFILLYFMPGFYCNVSDAWLFPEKSKRLWVTFAGAYLEIFIWALSTLVWRLTEPYTMVNNAALVVMATSGIKTLFNLNPLIKLDGYYLLSDYLDIPNFRVKAFQYLKNQFRRLLGSAYGTGEEISPRERRIFITYGLLAALYTTVLIGSFFMYLGGFLTREYQGWGFLLFLVFLTGLFRRRLRTIFYQPLVWLRSVGGNFTGWPKGTKTFAALAVLGAMLVFIRLPLTVTGEFTILPLHNADVRAEIEETIAQVFVKEGDTVRKGDPIVQLSDRTTLAELQKTQSTLEELGAKLKLLQAGPRPEEVKLARTAVEKAREVLRFAQQEQERSRALFERGLIPRREWERAQQEVAVREKELAEAQGSLNLVRAGSRKEEIEAARAELEGLEAQLRYLETQKLLLTVRSPAPGIIATPKLKEKVGQKVTKGELVAKVYEFTTVTVEIPVSEKEIADVKVGQPAVVRARAYPKESFRGFVASIATVATEDSLLRQKRTVVVRVNLDNSAFQLKAGMSGMAKIYGEKRSLFNLLLRHILRLIRVEMWSWW